MMRWLFICLSLCVLFGCKTSRTITITTEPADARIRINGHDRGYAPLRKELFVFDSANESYRIVAQRPGFRDEALIINRNETRDQIKLVLKPHVVTVTIQVEPAAQIMVDDKLVTTGPVPIYKTPLEFSVDPRTNQWKLYTVSAHREGYKSASRTVAFHDRDHEYFIRLEPVDKPLNVTSDPPGATVYLDGEAIGATPLNDPQQVFQFEYDDLNDRFANRELKVVKPGYREHVEQISYDDGRTEYSIKLQPFSKSVEIVSDPPGATILLNGKPLRKQPDGATSLDNLIFEPINEAGELPVFEFVAQHKTADTEWYPQKFTIAWDEGQTHYQVVMREIRIMKMPLLTWRLERDGRNWLIVPDEIETTASKDIAERGGETPLRLTRLVQGNFIDTLSASPDGREVLFNVLSLRDGELRSQMMRVPTDGSGAAAMIGEGRFLDLTPSFSADGREIYFSSNRVGRFQNIWSIPINGVFPTQRTDRERHDLWPSLNSEAKPRLFFQAMIENSPEPRIFISQRDPVALVDTGIAGTQPRIGPKNDYVVYCVINSETGKRDIYRFSEQGTPPENLTNTPDIDECDPAWSPDGSRIAFASDRGADQDGRRNFDIWIMDLTPGGGLQQITNNTSHDDNPQWDPLGNGIYFRSNRGGDWAIWRHELPE